MDWLPDGSFFVSDGYTGTRVAKFDKDGKFVKDWGIKGNPPNETRPGYMNNVHGVAVDVQTRRVFVNDRDNHRIQIFTKDGKYLTEFHQFGRSSGLAIDGKDVIYTADSESDAQRHPGWMRGIRIEIGRAHV